MAVCICKSDDNWKHDPEAAPDGWLCTTCGAKFQDPREDFTEAGIFSDIEHCLNHMLDAMGQGNRPLLDECFADMERLHRRWKIRYNFESSQPTDDALDCL